MKILNILIVLLAVTLYRCSSSEVDKEKTDKDLVSEVEQSLNDQPTVTSEENLFFEEKTDIPVAEGGAPVAEAAVAETAVAEAATQEPDAAAPEVKITEAGEYIIEKGDTLLLISFKLYGDYRKWRSVMAENPGISANNLPVGKTIKYTLTGSQFEWNKSGNAHLILKGDTLGTISNQHYGTNKRWREIFENNQPMILDPNLIFAGFTLYYVPDKVAQN